jgi:O-acetyl-ADP-ribose deacetylase (regulator of RNase III)
MEQAAQIAFKAIIELAHTLRHVQQVRFVLYSQKDLEVHERVLTELLRKRG